MEQSKEDIVEKLRVELRAYIKSNETVLGQFRKILQRLSVISIFMSLATMIGVFFLIYTVTKPDNASVIAVKQLERLSNNFLQQGKINGIDRRDIAKARDQIIPVIKMQDSLIKVQDSIIDKRYKKAIK